MYRKKVFALVAALMVAVAGLGQPKVYFTKEISPEALVRIYEALGCKAEGRVAVKISTVRQADTTI